jgi:hypothetical protein
MTHINGSDAVAAKCQYKELSDTLGWSREIKTSLTLVKARSVLWDAVEFGR